MEEPAIGGIPPLETHNYDGKYLQEKEKYGVFFSAIARTVSVDTKIRVASTLKIEINKNQNIEAHVKQAALAMIDIILSQSNERNYDPINELNAVDLLYAISRFIIKVNRDQETDHVNILAIDLFDMYKTGQCPQGRCTRLWQLFNMINLSHELLLSCKHN